MAPSRKRKTPSTDAAPAPERSAESVQDIFRRHFEAQFAPLPEPVKAPVVIEDDEEEDGKDDGGDEWSGVSGEDDSDEEAVEMVDHSTSTPRISMAMPKHERKAFMGNKPIDLTSASATTISSTPTAADDADNEDSATLLKQDIELQRLLNESHLLAEPTARLHVVSNTNKPFSAGKLRVKTTDMRIQALHHSAGSSLVQQNIPMNIRKGRHAAQAAREEKRRRDARENGVVLERKGVDPAAKKRRRTGDYAGPRVDMPGVGRMSGAELRISDRDVRNIEGPKRSFGRDRGGRRGGGRGGRR
ncbi:hypothetical protein TD95_005460 [Thielaviopsis punctulata]|uniref:Uncharacterized protein n=1 Tax=Thielaviopsis punctulata TaxID=72032 RepID=A0A0F4ZFI2_9PEZI|nr:hypothetical protein TD95_005460 [Thielaviopsis punctulata]